MPPPNCPPPPTNLPFCNAPPPCPAAVALPCPANPTQNCRPWTVHPPSSASNRQPALPCPTRPPVPVPKEIGRLTETEMTSNTAFSLITRYPVNSYERLQVALQLMQFSLEWWVNAFTLQNCHHDNKRVCIQHLTRALRSIFTRITMKSALKTFNFLSNYFKRNNLNNFRFKKIFICRLPVCWCWLLPHKLNSTDIWSRRVWCNRKGVD